MTRIDNRLNDQLRPVRITLDVLKYAEGSAYIEVGDTKVLCAVSIEEKVPPFLRGKGRGWITSEYSLLPRSTQQRTPRDITKGRISGRTQEIQRLIGRALRSVVNLDLLGERTIWIDCDVIQADGGTRTSSITGSFVALAQAFGKMVQDGVLKYLPLTNFVAATSVGIVNNEKLLDLCYEEDSIALIDMNVVMTEKGEYVEVQGTGEGGPFSKQDMDELMSLAEKGVMQLIEIQREVLGDLSEKIGVIPDEMDSGDQ
ncbi:ribonuclease PH [Calorimonas adulescens]|uniref:Ribonuclease PH n=1 Tax=Calorimonas adulescens TaxID=2606906 RepID=A0A5D8QB20_9THEO|nr:ribonuclease PH [Calorimonas adulescens]TZE81711.1 ribonuclease PH [Calorimonas adulescens]